MGRHYSGKLNWWHILLFVGILVALYMLFLAPEEEIVLEGTVTEDGRCTSRTGIDLVICCLEEDPETGEFIAVPCETTDSRTFILVRG